ncbi:MAG: glycosyltransferase family 39 protein [Planctomycetes bacterium]|nr:glycosyltransferase family 39 protein [Planctomycetota bacterium]
MTPDDVPPRPSRAPRLWALLLLFVLPLGLRAAALEHGLPRDYVPDTHIVRSALGMAKDKNPVPPVGKYSFYPNLLPYCLLPLYVGDFAVGKLTGRFAGAEDFGDRMLLHPEEPHLIARWLVAVLGSLLPWALFRAARAAGLGRGAWLAGFLGAFCLLDVQFGTQERPWAPMTTFIALAAWGSVVHARDGNGRALLGAGAAAGLAFATHQAGLMALALCGFAWLFSPLPWTGPGAVRGRWRLGVMCVLLCLVVSVPLGHPYWLVHGRTAASAVVGGAEANDAAGAFTLGGMTIVPQIRLESFPRLARALLGYDPVLVLLGLGGLALAWRRRALRPVVAWCLVMGAFFLTSQSDHVRYLLPVLALLALPAGVFGERLLSARLGAFVLALLCVVPVVQSLRFVQLLRRTDTRALAEERLAALPPSAVLAVDRYGPEVPPSQAALETLADVRRRTGGELYGRERRRLELLQEGALPADERGQDALRVEDLVEFQGRAGTPVVRAGLEGLGATPAALFAGLDVSHFLLVRRRPGEPHPLAEELASAPPLWVLDPAGEGARAPEAFLPLEMDFALTALWRVERPGPRLELYGLPRGPR